MKLDRRTTRRLLISTGPARTHKAPIPIATSQQQTTEPSKSKKGSFPGRVLCLGILLWNLIHALVLECNCERTHLHFLPADLWQYPT
jgi:hypothetical protein